MYRIGEFVSYSGQAWEIADVDISPEGQIGLVLVDPTFPLQQVNAGEEAPSVVVYDFKDIGPAILAA